MHPEDDENYDERDYPGQDTEPEEGPEATPFVPLAIWRAQIEPSPGVYVEIESSDLAEFVATVNRLLGVTA